MTDDRFGRVSGQHLPLNVRLPELPEPDGPACDGT